MKRRTKSSPYYFEEKENPNWSIATWFARILLVIFFAWYFNKQFKQSDLKILTTEAKHEPTSH
jgi:hypothetical protein